MNYPTARRIAAKELALFFGSPVGYLFLGSFLAATLFVFFWGEAFFARNIADVRPMFAWMPLLLIFLSAALTMRMWSEERRTGTLEFVVTVPVSGWTFVVGKFLACWLLLLIALGLTLPLPVSVAILADLDWGPVIAGYLAATLLGGAYLAIGLFVSARSDNQIVSLIIATLACGALYLVGSPTLTDLVNTQVADGLRSLGTGSRFESITRGVLDLRDLYYYVSLIAIFLALNVYALERQRWAADAADAAVERHRRWQLGTGLLIANLLVANLLIGNFNGLRLDMTEGRQYSISPATENYLGQLREPLLIRGYFSAKTHPLLAPLVPQIADLLREFEIAGAGKVRVEIIDPAEEPELEDEANSKYGIRAVPFQVADRYQSSLVNSYFDVLIQYGDEYEVLGFRDLIEIKVISESALDIQLRNPEYDIARSVKRVLEGFQSGGELFDSIPDPVQFVGYISASDRLPELLVEFRRELESVLDALESESAGKLTVEIFDPDADGGAIAASIAADYGFQPMAASLFDTTTFYFYLTLVSDDTVIQVQLPEDLNVDAWRRGLETGLKRFATGYLKTVALFAPRAQVAYMGGSGGNQYQQLFDALSANLNVERTQLENGRVPAAAELLVVVDPQQVDDKQLFAIDQFLMQGGTVALAAAPFAVSLAQQSLSAVPRDTGLGPWLDHHGLSMDAAFVMDPRNSAFPIPVTRQVGGFSFQEIRMLDFPYFVDVRDDGLNQTSPITQDLPQVTVPWSSPIRIDEARNSARLVTTLLESSPGSWQSASTDVMPRIDEAGLSAFLPEGEVGARRLGVMVEGQFDSFFAGQDNPLLVAEASTEAEGDVAESDAAADVGVVSGIIGQSPESARLVLFGANDFLSDQTLGMIGSAEGTVYGNSLQLMVNAVDFSLEDQALLSIRSRGHFNRTLPPLESADQLFWEYFNYIAALLGMALVFLIHRQRTRKRRLVYQTWLAGQEG
jgi:ABC-2 type transport system permease protein